MTLSTSFLLIAILWVVGALAMMGGIIVEVCIKDGEPHAAFFLKQVCSTTRIVGAFLMAIALSWGAWIILTLGK